jgi:3-keto-disaccharide hydrolase
MTATFDCPKCGAPLKFDLEPGQETVECSFCHETVIIPDDLRIPLPRAAKPVQPPPKKSSARNWIAFALVLIVCTAIITYYAASPEDHSQVLFSIGPTDTAFPDYYATDYPTDEPTAFDYPTDTPVADAGTATVEAQSTRVALGPLLKQEQAWPVKFAESFKDNGNGWDTGDVRDSYISGNRSIGNGLYTWNITAVQGASDFSFPIMLDDQSDFYASVDMKYEAMPNDADADAGLVFRYSDADQTWYYFSLNNEGQYYFGWYDGASWDQLIPETSTSAFHPGQINQLAVGASGSQFIFLINGQMVDEFVNDTLTSGTIGVGVNLPQAGERGKVQFSNVRVLSPVSTPDGSPANGSG